MKRFNTLFTLLMIVAIVAAACAPAAAPAPAPTQASAEQPTAAPAQPTQPSAAAAPTTAPEPATEPAMETAGGLPLVDACREKGALINCTQGNVLRFLPPLIVSREEIDRLLNILDEVLGGVTLFSLKINIY